MIIICPHAYAKVRYLTFHYNKPEFIEYQYKTLKKFMLDDYELIVFNDARDPEYEKSIRETCEKFGIQSVRYQQEWHEEEPLNYKIAEWLKDPNIKNIHSFISTHPHDIAKQPSVRHCHVIKYALEHFGYNHNDIVGLIDGDAFPIRPLSCRSLVSDCDIAGIQKRPGNSSEIDYLWVVFIIFDMRTMPKKEELNFDIALINNMIHDTGSETYHFLLNNPNIRCKKFKGIMSDHFNDVSRDSMINEGFTTPEINLIKNNSTNYPFELHLDKHLFHFLSSSFNVPGYLEKEILVKEFVEAILAE